MAQWDNEEEDLQDEEEGTGEEEPAYGALPALAPIPKLDPAKYAVTPTARAQVTMKRPELAKLPDAPSTDLTPEERVRWVISQKYLQPQTDDDTEIKEAKERAKWGNVLTTVMEGLDGYQRAQAQALGFGGVNRAAYDNARAGFDNGVTEAKVEKEARKKQAEAARVRDPNSPESVRAKELWGSVYKEAYGGKLPEGYDALTAADFTAGAKAVKEKIDGVRKERSLQADLTKQGNNLNFQVAGDEFKGNVQQSVSDANRKDTAARATAAGAQRTDQTNSYTTAKSNQQTMDQNKTGFKRQKDAAEIGVPGWKVSDASKVRPKETEVVALRSSVANIAGVNRDLDRLRSLYKAEGGKLILPNEARAEAASLAASLVFKIGTSDAKGALQAPELALIRQYIPDMSSESAIKEGLTKLLNEDASRFTTQIDTLKGRLNDDLQKRMTASGYEPDIAPAKEEQKALAPKAAATKQELKAVPEGDTVIYNGPDIKDGNGNIKIHSGSKVRNIGKGQFEEVK